MFRAIRLKAALTSGDNRFANVGRDNRLANRVDGLVEFAGLMLDFGWWNKYIAEEIAKHELGPRLGAVNRDNSKMFGPNFLNLLVDLASRFENK